MDMIADRKNPSLVVHPHVLVGDGTKCVYAEFMPRETLARYLARNGIDVPRTPIIVFHNGYRVPDALWQRLIPKVGDQIIIRMASPTGGDDDKILRTVAMVALIVVAGVYGAELGAALTFSGSVAIGVGNGLIMMGGSLLINALLPVNPPVKIGANNKFEKSPTYSISGGRNSLRPWEPMSIVFGDHRVVPDWGAKPYTEWIGEKQYFNQIFHFGLQGGNAHVSDMKIGNTPISNYKDVQFEIAKADGKLSLFSGNVDPIQGFVVGHDSGWISRTTPIDTEHISIEIASQLYYVQDNGSISDRSVDLEIEYRPVGSHSWHPIGTTYANYATHYWSARDYVEVRQHAYGSTNYADHHEGEFHSLQRYYNQYDATYSPMKAIWRWVPHPHSQGRPWRGYAPDPFLSVTSGVRLNGASQKPTRKTVSWNMTSGQYEIRIKKNTADISTSRESNETAVNQIICYQPDKAEYEGQLRLAVRILASEQLQGYIEKFSALVQPFCEVWVDGEWRKSVTRNPAWWLRHFAKGRHKADGTRLYGGGKSDEQIDDGAIKAFALWCDRKNLKFDFVLDSQRSTGDMLATIAKAGRGSITTQSGKLGVIWDDDNAPVVAMIAPFNIKAGSFQVTYTREPDIDEVVGTFTDRKTWELDEVRVRIPGATITNNPIQLDLEGVTEKDQAGREANLLAASQVFHRRRVTWEMDIEHITCKRGDVVLMSHDLTVWGYSGRLLGRDGNKIIVKDEIPSDGAGIMLLRAPDGDSKMVNVVSAVGDVREFTIISDMEGFPLPGDEGYQNVPAMDWAFFFDPIETPGRRMKIVSIVPSSDGSAKLTAIDDNAEYYACENNLYQYKPRRDGTLLGGVVFAIRFFESIANVVTDINNVQINWALSVPATVRVVIYVNGIQYSDTVTTERAATVQAQTGDVINVAIQPVRAGGADGIARTETYNVLGLYSPLPKVTGLTNVFRDGLTALVWDRAADVRPIEYEIRAGDSWHNSRVVAIVAATESLIDGNGLFYVAVRYVRSGRVVYGEPATLRLSGAALVRNVLVTVNEHDAWSGTVFEGASTCGGMLTLQPSGDILSVTDILALDDVLWFGGAAESGQYQTNPANVVDIGYEAPVLMSFDIDDYSINMNQNILSIADILAVEDVLSGSDRQHYTVTPQIRTSLDGDNWTEWRKYTPGIISARFFDVGLSLVTRVPQIIPFVFRFAWTIDVPDLVQRDEVVTVPSGGLRVAYEKPFHATPNVQIAMLDALNGDYYTLKNSDRFGFNIQMFNGESKKSMEINWLSQGY